MITIPETFPRLAVQRRGDSQTCELYFLGVEGITPVLDGDFFQFYPSTWNNPDLSQPAAQNDLSHEFAEEIPGRK